MRLAWERPEVIRMVAHTDELAALVAAARMVGATLADEANDQARELARVLASFDRAARALHQRQPGGSSGA
jgi:Ser/Thr protein kinase RdoA (MazF antagonist)